MIQLNKVHVILAVAKFASFGNGEDGEHSGVGWEQISNILVMPDNLFFIGTKP